MRDSFSVWVWVILLLLPYSGSENILPRVLDFAEYNSIRSTLIYIPTELELRDSSSYCSSLAYEVALREIRVTCNSNSSWILHPPSFSPIVLYDSIRSRHKEFLFPQDSNVQLDLSS